jgi:hypothetical protein
MKKLSVVQVVIITFALLVVDHALAQNEPGGFNTTGSDTTAPPENLATGKAALAAKPTGTFNTATGDYALQNNSTGAQNTATGRCALENNTSGAENTANGYATLNFNTTGYANTASGSFALNANTTGYSNVADGSHALNLNTVGYSDSATGRAALYSNTSGSQNTADGYYALYFNTTGSHNTAIGNRALNYTTTGEYNTALGHEAGYNVTTGSYNIEIGNKGDGADTGTIRLGTQDTQKQAFVAGIFGATVTGGSAVYVAANGQLGTLTSSAKYKKNIRDMGDASDALLALRPVTFQYKPEIDPSGARQFGLVAEEVEKVSPDLVVHDANHQIYSVRYEAVNAMLLNEFQKQHETIAAQEKTIAEQQKLLQDLAARVAELERR